MTIWNGEDEVYVEIQELSFDGTNPGTKINLTTSISSLRVSGMGRKINVKNAVGGMQVSTFNKRANGQISFDIKIDT